MPDTYGPILPRLSWPRCWLALALAVGGELGCDDVADGVGFPATANAGGGGSAATNGGGDAGAGGSLTPLVVFRPTTISDADADAAYEAWKAGFLEDCTNGLYRVRWSGDGTLTVSEGIGYGMLLTVIHDEQPIFDGLWQYYKNNRDSHGLMHWQRSGCEGAPSGDNAATDADLDAAMALVMASRRWSTTPYLADAQDLVEKIRAYETANGGEGLSLLKPGDAFGGSTCLNFSYFAPGYYRAFAEVVTDQAAFWTKLADDSYTLIARVANPATGLVPNWCDQNGMTSPTGPSGCTWYTEADQYGSDAARTPWRIATDYAWWGVPAAQTWLRTVTAWVKSVGIANIGSRYQLDGTATATAHTVVLVGAFADAAMANDQATVDEFFTEVVTMAPQTTYFATNLRALYLLLPLGRFNPQGGI
jgi:endo-1,4-beta-D-glucanase Y